VGASTVEIYPTPMVSPILDSGIMESQGCNLMRQGGKLPVNQSPVPKLIVTDSLTELSSVIRLTVGPGGQRKCRRQSPIKDNPTLRRVS
jgi:hypothetical protein